VEFMRMQPNANLSTRKIDNEIFIYDRDRTLIHTFNDTGAFLWNLLEQGFGKEAMTKRMTDEYEIDEQSAASDIESFLDTIRTLGLVVDAE
jgi:hypothetical protein